MSEDERIKRAMEVAQRRSGKFIKDNVNYKKEKGISKFGKFSIQVIASICIFGIVYFINQNYSFAVEKIKPVMSADTDFTKIYLHINEAMKYVMKEESENNDNSSNTDIIDDKNYNKEDDEKYVNEENIEKKEENNNENIINEENKNEIEKTQEQSEIEYIKNNISFVSPLNGVITSPYGAREATEIISGNHEGVDIGAVNGTNIVSATDGVVEEVSNYGDYGNHLKIKTKEIEILYAHCSKIIVNVGENIYKGQKIAEVGSTGKSTGPHLHFEIRINNKTIDPQQIIDL